MRLRKSDPHIFRIGITGGIGSGKTVVCKLFEQLGVPVLYADEIAKEIMDTNLKAKKLITGLLSTSAYKPDGSLDRAYVASQVFSSKTLQKKLNAIVHPLVEQEIDARIKSYAALGKQSVIVEAALIYEAGLDRKLDAVVVIDADEKERIDRVAKRDGIPASDIEKRINAQWSSERKLDKADYVLRNNGSLQDLETNVRFLYTIFNLITQKEQ
ncbi:MAG: dephospho-CoA kinase [Ignavibacteriales bacterium]|nr:dephospho-CoA kinase [Ignavibacteriales bacterium]